MENKKNKKSIIVIGIIVLIGIILLIILKKSNNENNKILEEYSFYNKVDNAILVNENNTSKNMFFKYNLVNKIENITNVSKTTLNNNILIIKSKKFEVTSIVTIGAFKSELLFLDDKNILYYYGGDKILKLANDVKTLSKVEDDNCWWYNFDLYAVYEDNSGEKYLLTNNYNKDKLTSININKLYGYVDGVFIVNDSNVTDNIIKYNNKNIVARKVFLGTNYDNENGDDSIYEEPNTIYVLDNDYNLIYFSDYNGIKYGKYSGVRVVDYKVNAPNVSFTLNNGEKIDMLFDIIY